MDNSCHLSYIPHISDITHTFIIYAREQWTGWRHSVLHYVQLILMSYFPCVRRAAAGVALALGRAAGHIHVLRRCPLCCRSPRGRGEARRSGDVDHTYYEILILRLHLSW